ncbi:ribonuclease HIII [Malacoplasma iowae]|uniref:ribonuclease HIII n=1 Tax=Malacoplasma iowae TaxID=2116 RepID=UPI00022C61CE|nr:ribonuclease HIII [Malacoplasma iowae]EGZ31598.1 ribonuclease HIII [Malacoplasma iowae 695]
MSQIYVKIGTKKDIELIKKYLNSFMLQTKSPSIDSIFKTKNYTITIYKNNKIMIQGSKYHNILKMIDPIHEEKHYNISKLSNPSDNPLLIGSDEVGTGDTFGGIVVASVYPLNYEKLKELNITDSKVYSNQEIINLYNKIKDDIIYEVYELYPNEYNDLYEIFNNLNIIKSLGHNNSHNQIIKKLKEQRKDYSKIIIDQFTPFEKYKHYLKTANLFYIGCEVMVVKAESKYLSVALASIVARYYFIKQINYLSSKYNIHIPFGSVTSVISSALKEAKKIDLRQLCKMHFKSVK